MKNNKYKSSTKGISLISLIIVIIVIIILAAIVIFTGLNAPDKAQFAKFMHEISDFRTAIQHDYAERKVKYSLEGKTRTDSQIYYLIASGADVDSITNISNEPRSGDEQYKYTTIMTLEELGINNLNIEGEYAYQITNDSNVDGWKQNKKYYEASETHWITDKGDVFVLRGYRVEENGTEKWYLNERAISNVTLANQEQVVTPDTPVVLSGFSADDLIKSGDVTSMFGKYVTNYLANTENGINYNNYNELVTNDKEKWQIFYIGDAGNGKNQIYLISSNYIKFDCMPSSPTGEVVTTTSTGYGITDISGFSQIVNDYNYGSMDVQTNVQYLNSLYFKYLNDNNKTSGNYNNAKEIAYINDITIWNIFANKYADFAIGSPSVELYFKSYNEKYNSDYRTENQKEKYQLKVTNEKGYQMSNNGGTSWKSERIENMFNTNDILYVINSNQQAKATYLSSPEGCGGNGCLCIHNTGAIDDDNYHSRWSPGFRPLICLSSDVKLEADGDNYKIVEDGRQDKNKTKHTYKYTGSYQKFEASETGYYKIECFGARGGKDNWVGSFIANYGLGGYAKGVIKLNKGEKLYLYVGENGADGVKQKNVLTKTSFNGGGAGIGSSDNDDGGGAGGGATDVRLVAGDWDNFESLKSRIMVAGGGSGGATVQSNFKNKSGGSGGGLTATGSIWKYSNSEVSNHSYNATQTTGFKFGIGQNGITKGNAGGAGAGGGYYGGYSSTDSPAGGAGGGSGYVSGYEGCNAISESSTENNIIHTNQSIHYSGKRFTDIELRADVSYNGKIVIEYLH